MKIIACIEHLSKERNLINTYTDKYDFKQFLTYESKCDICGTIRYRRYTYVIENDNGELVQVGTSCIDKLLDIKNISFVERALLGGGDFFENGLSFNGERYFSLKQLIKYLIIFPQNNLKEFKNINVLYNADTNTLIEKNDINSQVNDILNFLDNLTCSNEFTYNIFNCFQQAKNNNYYVSEKQFNLMKYVYKMYADFQLRQVASNEQGLTANVFTIKSIQKAGTAHYYSFGYHNGCDILEYNCIDTNNNIIKIKSTKSDLEKLIGKTVSCTIKGQYASKYGKVTVVSRIKELQ